MTDVQAKAVLAKPPPPLPSADTLVYHKRGGALLNKAQVRCERLHDIYEYLLLMARRRHSSSDSDEEEEYAT